MTPKNLSATDRFLEPQPLRVHPGADIIGASSEDEPLGVSVDPGKARSRGPFAALMSTQDLGDESTEPTSNSPVAAPAVIPAFPSEDAVAADRSTSGPTVDPLELSRSADEAQAAADTDGTPGSQTGRVAFDLPIFLRVLPVSGPAVAVAAARDPALADAVGGLPVMRPQEEVRTATKPSAVSDLPDFLVAAKVPTDAIFPSPGPTVHAPSAERFPARDAVAAVRRGFVAVPSAEPGMPSRKPIEPGSRIEQGVSAAGAISLPRNPSVAGTPVLSRPPVGITPTALKPHTLNPAYRALQDSIGAATPSRQSVGERADRPIRPVEPHATVLAVGGPMIAEPPMWAVGLSAGSPEGAALDGSAALRQPVGTEAWQDELSAQLSVMAEQGERSEAVMKLAPAELGELEIRIEIRGSEAAFQFGAASIETRQALELAQSRLREMMTGQGISVSEFSIFNDLSNKNDADSRRPQDQSAPNTMAQGLGLGAITDLQVTSGNRRSVGMVDLYA